MGNIVFRFTLAAMITALLATLAHAVFVLPDEITVAGRVTDGELRTDVVQDGVETETVLNGPVLLYSDVIAAPKTGWSTSEPNKGAVVTVWGRNLGALRGGSYVSVGGVNLTQDTDYAEPWGQEWPIPSIQKVSFWLTSAMTSGTNTIRVVVDGNPSNVLPLHVGTGNLLFVDITLPANGTGTHDSPFNQPGSALSAMRAGDTIYFKTGTYNQMYWGGGENIWVRPTAQDGTATQPITFTAYPNSQPLFDSRTANSSSFHTGIRIESPYYTVSKLRFNSYASSIIAASEHIRIVGNAADGGNVFRFGIGVITAGRDDVKVLGNDVSGGETGDRLDHAIYISGCAPNIGVELAHNYIHGNNFDSGPMIVVNHQDDRCPANVRLASHHIHSNFIDCTDYPSRAIGVYDQSWDPGIDTAGEPEPTFIYNNVVYNCGDIAQPVAYQNNGHVAWLNNTFYNSRSVTSSVLSVAGAGVLSTEIKNNIFHKSTSSGVYFAISNGVSTVSHNICYGTPATCPAGINSINADPKITVNTDTVTTTIAADSPAKAAGDDGVLTVVARDFYSKFRQVVVDIGAVIVGDN